VARIVMREGYTSRGAARPGNALKRGGRGAQRHWINAPFCEHRQVKIAAGRCLAARMAAEQPRAQRANLRQCVREDLHDLSGEVLLAGHASGAKRTASMAWVCPLR
jgi:hypothetical protein